MADGAEAAAEFLERLRGADLSWWCGSVGDIANSVNTKGYELMGEGQPHLAKEVLRLNCLLLPDNWIVWDSLAECCFNLKQYDESTRHYERSLELNPGNTNAASMLEEIRKRQR